MSRRSRLNSPSYTNDAFSNLMSALRRQGYAIVATNPNALNNSRVVSPGSQTYRTEHYAAIDATSLRAVYANWYNGPGGGNPNINPILVKGAFERLSPLGGNTEDQPRIPVTFASSRYKVIDGMSVAISDPAAFKVAKGERFFSRTGVTASVFANSPAAPTLTPSTSGGAIPTGQQYQVALSYVFPNYETVMGAATQSAVTGAGSANKITVTAPASSGGALGYRVWMTANGGSAGSTFYVVSPVTAFGTNFDNLYVPNTAGQAQTNQVGFPTGNATMGGTSFYGIDNGEGANPVADLVDAGYGPIISHQTGNAYSPIAIIGIPTGKLPPSPVNIGDSIGAGKGDDGIGGATRGGAVFRALTGITTTTITSAFVPNPTYGFMNAGPVPGEQLTNFIDLTIGVPRQVASMLGSTVISNYGTNDLAAGAAGLMARIIKLANLYVPAGIKLIQETYPPKTSSPDGWRNPNNQTVNADNGYRVIMNSWFRSTATSGATVTAEAAAHGAADGVARSFQPSQAFVVGTETVYVNGTPNAAYTYTTTGTLPNGSKAAGEIVFNTAPANGAAITFTYTAVPGFVAACAAAGSGLVDVYDVCAPIEVNSSGVLTPNGGFWLPAPAGSIDTGTVSSANSASITDSGKAWTPSGGSAAGQKGVCVHITADATTPASVGQVFCVAYNSATQLSTLSTTFTTVPSAGATYETYRPYTVDGVHPSSDGYRLMATMIDLTKIK